MTDRMNKQTKKFTFKGHEAVRVDDKTTVIKGIGKVIAVGKLDMKLFI